MLATAANIIRIDSFVCVHEMMSMQHARNISEKQSAENSSLTFVMAAAVQHFYFTYARI
jgi:hypothetical protein